MTSNALYTIVTTMLHSKIRHFQWSTRFCWSKKNPYLTRSPGKNNPEKKNFFSHQPTHVNLLPT